jgi:hypothetical protein
MSGPKTDTSGLVIVPLALNWHLFKVKVPVPVPEINGGVPDVALNRRSLSELIVMGLFWKIMTEFDPVSLLWRYDDVPFPVIVTVLGE